MCSVSTAAMAVAVAQPATALTGGATSHYVSGDFHNHTTCSDGSSSLQRMMSAGSVTYGLDWLIQTDHGGNSYRDCKFDDFGTGSATGHLTDAAIAAGETAAGKTAAAQRSYYDQELPPAAFKGDPTSSTDGAGPHKAMWRWQNIAEFQYPQIVALSRKTGRTMFQGVEQIVPGHEHSEVIVVNGQLPARLASVGNSNALAQFEYLYDRADNDMTGGAARGWTGKISNAGLVGNAAHAKSVAGVAWLQANYPLTSYYIPAHLERAGAFNPAGNAGFNIEHLRDYNNAGPTLAVGFESQPGHQALSGNGRGGYSPSSVGGGTFGGTGVYAAAIGGVWDALLGEGRNWFFFGSSDYHNRGIFSPTQKESSVDFFPGEYQKQWVGISGATSPQAVVNAIRSGDAFTVQGDLITKDLTFTACQSAAGVCVGAPVGMGRTLVVAPGSDVLVTLTVTLPAPGSKNNSPYSFANPVLKSINPAASVPLDQPVLDHIDLIIGNVTGVVAPGSANYAGLLGSAAATNPSAVLAATFGSATWTQIGRKVTVSYTIPAVTGPQYIRGRATNLPAGVPFATDAQGNPLIDTLRTKIACSDAACPPHVIPAGQSRPAVDADVRAWSELWVYLNPIFIRTTSNAPLLIETNANKARALAGLSPL